MGSFPAGGSARRPYRWMSHWPGALHPRCRTRDRRHSRTDDRPRPCAVGDAPADARPLRRRAADRHRRDLRAAAGAGPHDQPGADHDQQRSRRLGDGAVEHAVARRPGARARVRRVRQRLGGDGRVRRPRRGDDDRRRGGRDRPDAVEARLREDRRAVDQGGADGPDRHRLVGYATTLPRCGARSTPPTIRRC